MACQSLSFDRDSVYKSESIRRKQVSIKLTNIKNVWEKIVRLKKEAKMADPKTNKILMFKKINNPENKVAAKRITCHMTKDKADLFNQLFRSIIN